MDWSNIVTQFSNLVDKLLVSGILAHIIAILKAIGKFLIVVLEALLNLLKMIVK